MAEFQIQRVRVYKDFALSFGLNPVTNDVLSVTGAQAVIRAIKNLLLTNKGEVPFFPNFGTGLRRLLFEPIDPITTSLIETEIEATLNAFEPRAKILALVVTPNEDSNTYGISLTHPPTMYASYPLF